MTKLRYFLLALPLAGGVYLWAGHKTPSASAAESSSAEHAVARPPTLIAPGRVEPARDPVQLAFEAQGRISELLV
ncbi:MAG: hypothetical protein KIT31_36725, partial [Deltaproteobacteria bacterium]|nr:hypothetical protein [Deltaproteobacteria bacterium]